ncbi:hypothetical protein ACV1C4_17915 [Aeromonas hydrophila]|uniref:ADP-ribosyl-(dinitrogen reductase) hydrolase n=1 Tax=Aeromonas TaxID=642 RepID=UPI000F526DA4|nr:MULTISPECIES: ADP-ribosyl-(dinitrogen reductase) hydrolase [Aeromonas]RQM69848.1 ADP-ribosyl-(dinitrogen reductase) hydrolase [Aeromonas hydrophila]RUQ18980.1 ADP-ribosyl-(dinitrogen reductase) hydrolase [Aeromonas dhakensis]
MALIVSAAVRAKLKVKHCVEESEVIEAFANREKGFLIDTREDHQTNPPTEWFIAETDRGIKLKVCFMRRNGDIHIKTAYAANQIEIGIYNKYAV